MDTDIIHAAYKPGLRCYRHGCRCDEGVAAKKAENARRNSVMRRRTLAERELRGYDLAKPKPDGQLREVVEIAVARGMSPSAVMSAFGIDYLMYRVIRDRMDGLAGAA